jgi:mono/diheme cytochrome c family protein
MTRMMIKSNIHHILIFGAFIALLSCKAKNDYPGTEYAPNMYHAVPYEPLKQITDKTKGSWLSNREDGLGEYYNSNPNNPNRMNMRLPVPNTVARTKDGFLPYRVPKDSFDYAAKYILNPLDSTAEILNEGKALYGLYCTPCHGEKGMGDGLVGEVFKGVPLYNVGRVKDLPEGHLFHTITHGRGRMGAHGSQIGIADRWKIVRYVQVLQNQ